MNFNELIKYKIETCGEDIPWDDPVGTFEQGARMARVAIVELLMKVNEECETEAKSIENLINIIKHGKDYE